jgi:D-alanyl-D-alanine carboxypeptidase-like protein
MSTWRQLRRGVRLLGAAALSLVVLVACQPDPTDGNRPPPPGASVDPFGGTIGAATREDVRVSWREGCPVHWRDLSVVRVSYWGYDGERHRGAIVVHDLAAPGIRDVFESLYRQRFQVERISRVDEYEADDDASMAANNTSAFNCRKVAGTSSWSMHSYGTAIDVNPMQNPYVVNGTYSPPGSEQWANRSDVVPGMAVAGNPLVGAFDYIHWKWGGRWTSKKDYQHFSINGQ